MLRYIKRQYTHFLNTSIHQLHSANRHCPPLEHRQSSNVLCRQKDGNNGQWAFARLSTWMPQRLKCLTKKQLLAQYRTESSNLVPIKDVEEPAKIQAHIRKKKSNTNINTLQQTQKMRKINTRMFPFSLTFQYSTEWILGYKQGLNTPKVLPIEKCANLPSIFSF